MTDETDDKEPFLVKLGANERGAPEGHNLDVSGTVGPDYLGQETVDVDGHPCNRPGVRSRLDQRDGLNADPRIRRMDTGEELPVLLSSDMRTDPIEATQGTFTQIVEGWCPRCGYDRLRVTVQTLAGHHQESCMACEAIVDSSKGDGFRMPLTERDRARQARESGPALGSITNRTVIDREANGGSPRVALVADRGATSFRKDDIESLFWMLVDNGDIDLVESVHENLVGLDVIGHALDVIETAASGGEDP